MGRDRARGSADPTIARAILDGVRDDPTAEGTTGTLTTDVIAARHDALARLSDAEGVDVLLFFGNEAARHDIRYAADWTPGWDTYLVVRPGQRPMLLIPSPNHVPTAVAHASEHVEVSWSGPDPVETIARLLTEGGGRARVGIIGPLPHRTWVGVAARLPDVELTDASAAFVRLRIVKDDVEIARARRAARLCDLAVEELRTSVQPGMRDFELGALLEHAYRRRGGEHGICFLASGPMDGGGAVVPAQVWSDRTVAEGDVVMLELSVGVDGVTSQVLRSIAIGLPTPDVTRLHGVADEAFAALREAARPGTPVRHLLEVAGLIDRAGMTVVDDVVHGYGGGYLPPVLRTPATQRRPVPELDLEVGMFLVIQPNVVSADGRLGVQTGELVVVTEHGAERIHTLPTGLLAAG